MEILEIVKNSHSYKECLEKLNLRPHGSNYVKIKKIIKEKEISIEHFWKPNKFMIYKLVKLEDILIENSTFSRTTLKIRLYKEGLKKRECELCGQGEMWQGKKMSLILDHINGIYNDNRLENLQIVCPNCNATLDTHAGKNIKHNCRTKENIKKFCNCGVEIITDAENCPRCAKIKQRIIERPKKDFLLEEIKELGYVGTGKKYGVSDNAIRKWLKNY